MRMGGWRLDVVSGVVVRLLLSCQAKLRWGLCLAFSSFRIRVHFGCILLYGR